MRRAPPEPRQRRILCRGSGSEGKPPYGELYRADSTPPGAALPGRVRAGEPSAGAPSVVAAVAAEPPSPEPPRRPSRPTPRPSRGAAVGADSPPASSVLRRARRRRCGEPPVAAAVGAGACRVVSGRDDARPRRSPLVVRLVARRGLRRPCGVASRAPSPAGRRPLGSEHDRDGRADPCRTGSRAADAAADRAAVLPWLAPGRAARPACVRTGCWSMSRRDDRASGQRRRADADRDGLRRDRGHAGAAGEQPPERLDPRRAGERGVGRLQPRAQLCRARNSSDSTAGPETASAAASSSYERPPNSRRSSASRCWRGSSAIARQSAARSARRIASASGSGQAVAGSTSLHGERLAHARPGARPALVARDRREPGGRLPRRGAVEQRAVSREERLLRRVLGLGRVAQQQRGRARRPCGRGALELLGPRARPPRHRGGRRGAATCSGALVVAPSVAAVAVVAVVVAVVAAVALPAGPPSELSWSVTVWPTSDAGSVSPPGSGTVSVWPVHREGHRSRPRPPRRRLDLERLDSRRRGRRPTSRRAGRCSRSRPASRRRCPCAAAWSAVGGGAGGVSTADASRRPVWTASRCRLLERNIVAADAPDDDRRGCGPCARGRRRSAGRRRARRASRRDAWPATARTRPLGEATSSAPCCFATTTPPEGGRAGGGRPDGRGAASVAIEQEPLHAYELLSLRTGSRRRPVSSREAIGRENLRRHAPGERRPGQLAAQADEQRLERERRRELELLRLAPGGADELAGPLGPEQPLPASRPRAAPRSRSTCTTAASAPAASDDEVAVPPLQLLEHREQLVALGAALRAPDALLRLAARSARAPRPTPPPSPSPPRRARRCPRAAPARRPLASNSGIEVDGARDAEQRLAPLRRGRVEQPLRPVEPAAGDARERRHLLVGQLRRARADRGAHGALREPPERRRAGSASGSSPAAGRGRPRRARSPRTAAAPRDP